MFYNKKKQLYFIINIKSISNYYYINIFIQVILKKNINKTL